MRNLVFDFGAAQVLYGPNMAFSCFVFSRGLWKGTGINIIGSNFGETNGVHYFFFLVERSA
jgi:hypothetical protein